MWKARTTTEMALKEAELAAIVVERDKNAAALEVIQKRYHEDLASLVEKEVRSAIRWALHARARPSVW